MTGLSTVAEVHVLPAPAVRGRCQSAWKRQHLRREDRRLADAAKARRLAEKLRGLPEVRRDRVERIRAQIAAGTYLTEEKLTFALELLASEMVEV